jgi:RHS repeat-associated protein
MEKDNEISGNCNSYTTEFRQLDVRLGRWFSRDPIERAFESDYAGFSNNPIIKVDPDGDSDFYTANGEYLGSDGTDGADIHIVTNQDVIDNIKSQRIQSSSDPTYYTYKATLEEGTFFSLPPYSERQEINQIMKTQEVDQRNEVGGKGYKTNNGKSTFFARAVDGAKVSDLEFENYIRNSLIAKDNGTEPPKMEISVDLADLQDEEQFDKWKNEVGGKEGGTQLSYTWHSHPHIQIWHKENKNGQLEVSFTNPIDKSWSSTIFGGDENDKTSDPSNYDLENPKSDNNFVISKKFSEVTHYDRNNNKTNMKNETFYNTQAKTKP